LKIFAFVKTGFLYFFMNRLLTRNIFVFQCFDDFMNNVLITDFVDKKDINSVIFGVENCCKNSDKF